MLRLPTILADVVEGRRALEVDPTPPTVRAMFDALAASHPALERRVRDERGDLRRFVNVYVGDDDVRHLDGQATALTDGAEVWILPSVAGG
jgi:molybdopterin converting factor small subunit